VYLWGAGATQAEADYLGAKAVNLLMRDDNVLGEGIATRIIAELPKRWQLSFRSDSGTDIEKLISLLVASNVKQHQTLAQQIRQLYFEDICAKLAEARVLSNPQLAIGLLTLHANESFKHHEVLSGMLTTNHDGLLQLAAQTVHKQVNIGIPFQSESIEKGDSQPPILQLHGSFTWSFGLPLQVSLLEKHSRYSDDMVWIPPTILKESKSYPFNRLMGGAYELLAKRCDVLRVVGCSLTQNDWNVLSLIFNAQRHLELERRPAFRIELIASQTTGDDVAKNCSYLRLSNSPSVNSREDQRSSPIAM
jgi:hypothetical protein